MKNLVIITWVSWCWKTTLQNEMLKQWWRRPINFSTRKPRDVNSESTDDEWDFSSPELNEYVFLSENDYFTKLKNWDFLEHTNYNWNWYWISKYLPEWNICVILDPVWREQVLEKISRENPDINVVCVYLDIIPQVQEERLINRWDVINDIEKRKKDFNWFFPFWLWGIWSGIKWIILDGTDDVWINIRKICETLKKT